MIGMKINKKETSVCDECGTKYKFTPEMYDMILVDKRFTFCKDCVDKIFTKTLRCDVMYNSRLKGPDDMERIRRYKNKKGI